MTTLRIMLMAVALLSTLLRPAGAEYRPQAGHHVLVLHSFHPGYPWSDQVMVGIQDILSTSMVRVHMDVEYLDVKSQRGSIHVSQMVNAVLHHKFSERSFDLILAIGDEATRYALEHQKTLFHSRPVISCTIGEFNQTETPHVSILAEPDFRGVIDQALKFHPHSKSVVVLGGSGELSDRLNNRLLNDVVTSFSDRATFEFWDDLPAEEILNRLKLKPKDTIVLVNSSIRDRSNELLSFHEQSEMLRQTGLPLYSFWSVFLGEGIVGGPLLDMREQGRKASRVALRVLAGEPASSIPPQKVDVTVSTFDFRELQRLGIAPKSLPPGAQLINDPPPFYKFTRTQILWFSSILIVSLCITLMLAWNTLQRRQAEHKLRQSEQNYRHLAQQFQIILDGIPDSLTLVSRDMKVIWSNKGAGKSFGAPLRTVPGEVCCELLYNRSSLCDNCPATRAFESGRNEESTITTPDGRTLEVKAFPVDSENGRISHVIMLACDITEKVRLLEESLMASRLASLGELAAGVAHEINNPNAVIMLNIDLIKKTCRMALPLLLEQARREGCPSMGGLSWSEIGDEMPLLLNEMGDSSVRIKRIVDDLKNFARIDEADVCEPININEVVRASARLASNAIKNATDHFVLELSEGLPEFMGSFQHIEQVVINLLMNSCQSLPSKERSIIISTRHDHERSALIIQVCDQGEGIPAEILPRITDPFFTSKRNSGGTGLGLSISMRLIRGYGGNLEFDSTPGQGTTATIILPHNTEPTTHDH